jgi:hypothetical protein
LISEERRGQALADSLLHQMRVLILVTAIAEQHGNAGKLDGLTKLAKLDFLIRYPHFVHRVLGDVEVSDPRLHLEDEVRLPMIRYRYGPWDDRYYPVVGALVGRGLLRYRANRRGNVALSPTPLGKSTVLEISFESGWRETLERCQLIAEATVGLTGTALKNMIYEKLPQELDIPQRKMIL